MLLSKLFSKTERSFPKDEEAVNAKFLIRAGFVRKMSAGIFTYLPLAQRVLNKINAVIREEMNAIGGEELLMPALVAKEYWEKSKRWDVEVVYKLKSQFEEEFGLGWTHEEVISSIAGHFIQSYKDLPKAVYQIQNKFRSEQRAKNGLLRGREFMMKDLYSFHATKEDLDDYYNSVIKAYSKIFKRLGLKTFVTEASGGAFTKEYTHEFQVLSGAGEDVIFYCEKCEYARNKELIHEDDSSICSKCDGNILNNTAIEVGNVFKLGTRYSEAFNVNFLDKNGFPKPVIMGSYGIGPTRVLATLVEVYHDERGIIWPKIVAPYAVHLISLGKDKKVLLYAKKLYSDLEKKGVEVLYDDRECAPGEKFADADLIGIPYRIVISEKTLVAKKLEVKERGKDVVKMMSFQELMKVCSI